MPGLLLSCLLLFCSTTGWATDHHRIIRWYSSDQYFDLNNSSAAGFEGSLIRHGSDVPYWFESFEINAADANISIKDTVFEPYPDSLTLKDISLGTDLQLEKELGISAGRSILRVTILPFVRRNSRIEKLVEFTLSVNENFNRMKSAKAAYPWKSTSVLGSGKWVKVGTKTKGIYKITFDQLTQWGFSNPDQVVVYGNGGYMLPVFNKDLQLDDLNAYPVWKGKDNTGKDCLFFYSTGNIRIVEDVETGTFTHQQNYYSTETFFYLSAQGPRRNIDKAPELTENAGRQVTSFSNYSFHEKEALSLIASGSRWFGEAFNSGSTQTVNLTLTNPEPVQSARFDVSAAGKSSSPSTMTVSLNGKTVNTISFVPVNNTDPTAYYADDKVSQFSETLPSENLQIKLTYNASNSTSAAWLDYIGINYKSLLNMKGDVFLFRGKGVAGPVQVSEFVLSGASASVKIFDVTDISNTFEVPAVYTGGQLKFKSNSGTTREYVAFNPAGSIPSPDLVGSVANQNLHAAGLAEMIIVSDSSLISAANDLASFHQQTDKMKVQVVTPELIYNEFSGGLPDPSGFRNYFRRCYDLGKQSGENTLKYVLLMGEGSYDNRNIQGKKRNMLPTYQSDNSLSPTESFVTDDFFVFLDENEGGSVGTVDLGIGRLPVKTLEEARIVIGKIMNYNKKETLGNWRNVVTFIGDDEDFNTHMGQSESLATFVNKNYPGFFTDKIYFDAYKQISGSGGEKYPDVTLAINNRVKQGTLIMNYTGHANEKNMAAENVLEIPQIDQWSNQKRLPVFVTATCEYSRFDADETTAGEHILLNPWGGGVGLFSTTRLVYSGANFVLNRQFFNYIFEKDEQGNNLRLGDVMRLAKASANTGINQLNFTLLADPAMRLANPGFQVKTTSIDGKDTGAEADTIKPLSVVTVKGFVADNQGVKLSSFDGEIIPTVYDKAMQVKTLGNAGEEPMDYTMQNNIIYRGLASVENGEFSFSFIVPKDISVKPGKGKILYYGYTDSLDAQGYFDNFFIGGTSNSNHSDLQGPQIELFMNSESFREGGTVSASSVLLANITDESGINTAGIGIGHDITAVLDGDYSNIMVLNDYFQADKDSYTSGKIVFPLTELSEGEHVLKVKVWDVLNNSSEKEIRFVVRDDFRIGSVSCYPNPVSEQTNIVFTHNQPDETFDVRLEIFQTTGTLIDVLQARVGSAGTESLPLRWSPLERNVKMRPGVYIYRISVATNDGKTGDASGRLVFVYR